jgi:hypothetical protein
MDTTIPTPTSRSPHDSDLRRTSRVERPVPLLILGTNRRGETFQEKTYAIVVNLHGCRYHSRHDYAPASSVSLQVTGTDGANSPVVRARVCSVISARTPRELFQVGIELETPGNVWGISAPPLDWRRFLGTSNSGAVAAGTPALEPAASPRSYPERQSGPAERSADVTVFPGPSASATSSSGVSSAKDSAPNETARGVITAEQLRELQIAADKAIQTSLSTQLDEAVKIALGRIEDGSRANIGQTQESSARLAEVQNLWEREVVVYRNRAEEIARRIELAALIGH